MVPLKELAQGSRRAVDAAGQDALATQANRAALSSRWLTLTRVTLPAMAKRHRWPIRLDHCFMRVCLDHALGCRWDTVVRRPAIRHLTDEQLARAVDVAASIQIDPALLPGLNRLSLVMRGVVRAT